MTEGRAIMLTGTAHLALFAALSLGWSMTHRTLPVEEAIPVDVIDVSDLPRVTELPKPSMEAAPQETVEEAAPEPDVAEPTPPEEVVPEPLPDPVPAPEPKPEPKPAPKPEPKKPEPQPKPEPKTEAKKKAPERMDAQELANLLDKSLPKAKRKPLETADFAKSIEQAIPKGAKLDARATATLVAAIRAQVAPCWNPPIGGADVRDMTVMLRIRFARDGKVIGAPTVVSQTAVTADNQAYARVFAESAKRAVVRCSPLQLPADMYDAWKEIDFNFDPSQMT